jgi:uncharacterized membrane protein
MARIVMIFNTASNDLSYIFTLNEACSFTCMRLIRIYAHSVLMTCVWYLQHTEIITHNINRHYLNSSKSNGHFTFHQD